MKKLCNSRIAIEVSEHGAELCSLRSNGREYLWQADPKFWGRHSPVLFPIVGSVWEKEYRHEGQSYPMGQHGFARDMEFEIIHESDNELLYQLKDTEDTRRKYPFEFCLEIGYRLNGNAIKVSWKVVNTGEKEMWFQIGAHPAFYYPDHEETSDMCGYFGFDKREGLSYILVGDKGCAATDKKYPLHLTDGLLPIDTHTFDRDALILENSQIKEVTLYDVHKAPYLTMRFDAPVTGLWSPPHKDAPFVCIEPWYGRCDRVHYAGELKDKEWIQRLAPKEQFEGGYEIEILK